MNVVERAYDFLLGRRKAYRQVFAGPVAEIVLADLAQFCNAEVTTFRPDPRESDKQAGRREVWLRIQYHMQLPPDALWKLYDGRSLNVQE